MQKSKKKNHIQRDEFLETEQTCVTSTRRDKGNSVLTSDSID